MSDHHAHGRHARADTLATLTFHLFAFECNLIATSPSTWLSNRLTISAIGRLSIFALCFLRHDRYDGRPKTNQDSFFLYAFLVPCGCVLVRAVPHLPLWFCVCVAGAVCLLIRQNVLRYEDLRPVATAPDFACAVMDGHGQNGHHVSGFVQADLGRRLTEWRGSGDSPARVIEEAYG